jgi:hypothetical protein
MVGEWEKRIDHSLSHSPILPFPHSGYQNDPLRTGAQEDRRTAAPPQMPIAPEKLNEAGGSASENQIFTVALRCRHPWPPGGWR